MTGIDQDKQQLREMVWHNLLAANVVPSDSYGKIPSFVGAERGAELLRSLDVWKHAATVKANPDHAQLHSRAHALSDRKLLYMAVPKMASLQPFFRLDPALLDVAAIEAATKGGARRTAQRVGVEDMRPIDLVICGSVAVNTTGARLGKGAGYSDLEVALLTEAGLITDDTSIVASVHSAQVIDESIPEAEHDFSVDYIITPAEVLRCSEQKRPQGIDWDTLTAEKAHAIPALVAQRRRGESGA